MQIPLPGSPARIYAQRFIGVLAEHGCWSEYRLFTLFGAWEFQVEMGMVQAFVKTYHIRLSFNSEWEQWKHGRSNSIHVRFSYSTMCRYNKAMEGKRMKKPEDDPKARLMLSQLARINEWRGAASEQRLPRLDHRRTVHLFIAAPPAKLILLNGAS